jgi:hypothetical protein
MNKLLIALSWLALIFLPALGWRLQGATLTVIGLVVGITFFVWAHDWEVREIVKRDREARDARRIGG